MFLLLIGRDTERENRIADMVQKTTGPKRR